MARSPALLTNYGVDYVITYKYDLKDKQKAAADLERLLSKLSHSGLATEVRNGNDQSLLIFVKVASDEHMGGEIFRSRVKDWIHGVRSEVPPKDTSKALEKEPLTEAERLRIVYQLITNPVDEGGAGITPNKGEWEAVTNVFPLHDHVYNKEWIKKWSTQWFLQPEDLDQIRDRMGEKVAFYFAFTQSYFTFLMVPAGFGLFAWLFLGYFSPWYAVVASVWCVVFVEWWKHQERDLAARWGTLRVSNIEVRREGFKPEIQIEDPITGETMQLFPARKRLMRQLLALPYVAAALLVLGALITTAFGIEVFISEVYNGPFKSVLVFLPTVLLTTGLPLLTGLLTNTAYKLADFENYETDSAYERSITSKTFVLQFITSYLPVMLTAFVYVPFGSIIVPHLDIFSLTVKPFAEDDKQMQPPTQSQFDINPARLRKQVIYFTVTAQIVNFATEVIVPYLKRQGLLKYKEMQSKRAAKSGGLSPSPAADDPEEEKEFLQRVRSEAELTVYNVYDDLKEMIVQFGYLALFSVVWPLVPVSFLINNWVELRSDAVKICVEMQRPVPWRADTIGPWLDALEFLSWFGSITLAALTYMFANDSMGPDGRPSQISGWALLLSIFFSEHLFLATRWAVSTAISKIDSPGRQKARRQQFMTRRRYFQESLDATKNIKPVGEDAEEITREMLENEAREGSLRSSKPAEIFWRRQRGWQESAKVGKGFIERDLGAEQAGKEKKEL